MNFSGYDSFMTITSLKNELDQIAAKYGCREITLTTDHLDNYKQLLVMLDSLTRQIDSLSEKSKFGRI